MQHRRVILLLVTAALTVPAATAWSVNGAFEPDTPDDIEGGRMWVEPDTSTSDRKVYFNALPADRNGQSFNPNVGALGTRYIPAGQMGMTAWLGIWKDCNRDGYIGMAETAVNEYRAELLLDDAVCPSGSAHNRNSWVSEFIYLSPDEQPGNSATFPRVFHDPGAKVWGDFGRPGEADEVHYDCAQFPLPSGTMDSTGGFLLYFDCQLGYGAAQVVNDVDAATGLGIGFDDRYHPERDCDNPLNVHLGVYGENYCNPEDPGALEGNTTPAATVWDCDTGGGELLSVPDPTDPTEPLLTIDNPPSPSPAVNDPEASVYSAYQRAATPCEDEYGGGLMQGTLGADFSGTNPTDGKRLADFDFGYSMPAYGLGGVLHQGLPGNAGVRGLGTGAWDSGVTYLPPTYLGGTVRNGDLAPAGGLWFTFYAYVGPNTLALLDLPTETPGVYGFEACADNEMGIHGGWDCDVTHWWNPEMGGSANEDGPVPGDLYHLRDNDCYDGSLAEGSGVYASLALLSDDPPCPAVGGALLG